MNIRKIFDRDTILHLRIPFSLFLLPVFCFGVSQAASVHIADMAVVFIALHLFIYPGSNAYNSYMDKDEGSIGGLEKPPPVTRSLLYASIIFDALGLSISLIVGWQMMLLLAVYVLFSKAYSWAGIRLKKRAIAGWATVALFQGGYTFLLANMAVTKQFSVDWFTSKNLTCMLFATLIIGGSYPLTQVYQHDEDGRRGDRTISYKLGIVGTFIFTGIFFTAGAGVALYYFIKYYSVGQFFVFVGCTLPVIISFFNWFLRVRKDRAMADFRNAMFMNKISSVCMIICFCMLIAANAARTQWTLW
jgi:1,4-dihydroxy-2-naphthoate octaprenyltransferase